MYNYIFGTKENVPQGSLSKSRSSGLTGQSLKMRVSKTKKTDKKEKNMVIPMSSFENCTVDQLESLDPGLAKARAVENILNSNLNLEIFDPNNMVPLSNENERLTTCKVCTRNFSPQRIGTHQSICQRMAKRDAKGEHKSKHYSSKPAPNTPKGAKAKQKLVRPQSPNPTSSVRKPLPSNTIPNVGRPRPMTAKPDLEDCSFKKVNSQQSNKKKRPLSALACLLPNFLTKPKVEVDERIACPTCQRKFNKDSAAHHIPWCAKQAAIISPAKPSPRRKYVVPKLKRFATDAPVTPQKLKQKSDISSTYPVIPISQENNNHRRGRSKAGPASIEPPVNHTRTSNRRQLPEAELKPTGSRRSGTQAKVYPEKQSADTSNRRQVPAVKLKSLGPGRNEVQAKSFPETQLRNISKGRPLPSAEIKPTGPERFKAPVMELLRTRPGRSEFQAKIIPETQLQNTSRGRFLPSAERKPTGPERFKAPVMELLRTRPGRSEFQAKSIPETQSQNTSRGRPLPSADIKPMGPERCKAPVMGLLQTQARNVPQRRQLPVIETKLARSGGTRTEGRPQTQSEKRYTHRATQIRAKDQMY